jgi:light-regulated signal transduction histidine kinase (bacteriophytochrome)
MQNEKLEELVAQRTVELKRSNEDLQQFAHVASHDLKEPVRKIRTFSQRLAEEYGAMVPEKGRTFIDKIQASSERMAHMIDSILSYSVVTATEMEEEAINLNLLLEGITSDLELLILQKEASINVEKLPGIKGIPTLIYQLFYNLINNALKFSKTDTPAEIQIYGRKLPPEEIASFDLRKSGSYVEIIVKDNGIGFSQEYADKVFNVFTRLNSRDKYEGTGLGLALCRKIVHRHGGVIRAKSAEGEGAEFHIILPAGI